MSTYKTSSKVPLSQKIAFGVGMLANQMFPAVIGIFIVVLVKDLGFPGWMWGVISLFQEFLMLSQTLLWDLFQITQNLNGVDEDNMFLLGQL